MKTGNIIRGMAAVLACAASMSYAASISWNLDRYSTIGGDGAGSFPGAGDTAGVEDVGYWHNSWPDNPTINLRDSRGAPTSLDIVYTSGSGSFSIADVHPGQDADGSWNKEMLNGFLNGTGTNSTSVTLNQIPYALYDVYVYFASDDATRNGTVTDGTTTYSFGVLDGMIAGGNASLVQTTDTGAGYPEANFAVFSDLSGDSQTISTSFAVTNEYGGIAAVQVVDKAPKFEIVGSPLGSFASGSAVVEATIVDGIETIASATLYLDDVPVATNDTPSGTTNTVSYSAMNLVSGVHTCRVDVVSAASDPDVEMSYGWSFEVVPFVSVTPSPTGSTTSNTVILQAIVVEGASIVDTNLTTLSLNGSPVTPLVFDRSTAPTTTVSGVVSGLSIGTYTGQVVVVGDPNGTLTNEWTFTVSPPPVTAQAVSWNWDSQGTVSGGSVAGVVSVANWNNSWPDYNHSNLVDSAGATTTLDIEWDSANSYQILGSHPGADSDGTFNKELLNGYLNSGVAGWTEKSNSWVTVSQIPYSSYDIYVYFSSDVAGRLGWVTDGTTTNYFQTLGATSIESADALLVQATATTDVGYGEAANYAVYSGLTGASQTITVSIPNWGGIAGIQVVNTGPGGPTVPPVITSISVSGGNVTVTWNDEGVGTYSVLRKTALSAATWDTVAGGIPAGTGSSTVAASGADEEFYRVKGE